MQYYCSFCAHPTLEEGICINPECSRYMQSISSEKTLYWGHENKSKVPWICLAFVCAVGVASLLACLYFGLFK